MRNSRFIYRRKCPNRAFLAVAAASRCWVRGSKKPRRTNKPHVNEKFGSSDGKSGGPPEVTIFGRVKDRAGRSDGGGGAPVGRDVRGRHGRSRRCPCCSVAAPLTSEARSTSFGRGTVIILVLASLALLRLHLRRCPRLRSRSSSIILLRRRSSSSLLRSRSLLGLLAAPRVGSARHALHFLRHVRHQVGPVRRNDARVVRRREDLGTDDAPEQVLIDLAIDNIAADCSNGTVRALVETRPLSFPVH